MSLNYLATRFQCTWPWDILVMLCDGRMVCGCADPYGKRVLGDARAGKGTLGRLVTDETLYNNINQTASNVNQLSSEGTKLIYDFRQNPRKYLRIKVSLF